MHIALCGMEGAFPWLISGLFSDGLGGFIVGVKELTRPPEKEERNEMGGAVSRGPLILAFYGWKGSKCAQSVPVHQFGGLLLKVVN